MAGGTSQVHLTRVAFEQGVELKEQMIKKTAKVMQMLDDKHLNKILHDFLVQDEQHIKMLQDKINKLHLV
jgi:ketopantoate reductase